MKYVKSERKFNTGYFVYEACKADLVIDTYDALHEQGGMILGGEKKSGKEGSLLILVGNRFLIGKISTQISISLSCFCSVHASGIFIKKLTVDLHRFVFVF